MDQLVEDKKYIQECINLSKKAAGKGDNPFGAVIVGGKFIFKGLNNIRNNEVSNHAEIIVMRKAQKRLKTSDLSSFTIYSIMEPCPMCSFMIRELKFKRVVYSLFSPYFGGYSKWSILQDKSLSKLKPVFADPPQITPGVLHHESKKLFDSLGWTIHS